MSSDERDHPRLTDEQISALLGDADVELLASVHGATDQTDGDDLSEGQLDAALRAADRELLAHAMAATDPMRGFIALMQSPPEFGTPAVDTSPESGAAAVIALRLRARELAFDFDNARLTALTGGFDAQATLSRVRMNARDLVAALDPTRDPLLALDLDVTLDPVFDPSVDSTRARALSRARTLARDLERAHPDLDAACGRIGRILALLDEVPVDASALDLSRLPIVDLGALLGVIWTDETVWPIGIGERVRAGSQEIRRGVYQVRLDNEREHAFATL